MIRVPRTATNPLGRVGYSPLIALYERFTPRPVCVAPPFRIGPYRLKVYTIVCGPDVFDPTRFADAEAILRPALPANRPVADGTPHVGFVIEHQGRAGDYLVLAWWDRQNELPLRIWVRRDGAWRPARDAESVCVWDLEIIWFERNLWIATGLSGRSLDEVLQQYASTHFAHR